jgi:hypothetical protein
MKMMTTLGFSLATREGFEQDTTSTNSVKIKIVPVLPMVSGLNEVTIISGPHDDLNLNSDQW